MSKRVEILKQSLVKKESQFSDKLSQHFDCVKQANGQPLNDKRNGAATLNKWDRQNNSLRSLQKSIEKTKQAIEDAESFEAWKERQKNTLPAAIVSLMEAGELSQWAKHPSTFFVNGVDKARIVYDSKKNIYAHKFTNYITDKEQWKKFAKVFNQLHASAKAA